MSDSSLILPRTESNFRWKVEFTKPECESGEEKITGAYYTISLQKFGLHNSLYNTVDAEVVISDVFGNAHSGPTDEALKKAAQSVLDRYNKIAYHNFVGVYYPEGA